MKRRQFIQNTALLSGSLAFGPFINTKSKSKEKSLGIALVGLGSYAGGQIAPALQQTVHAHLAGIVTGSPTKIPAWKKRHGLKDSNIYNYENMHRIADNPDIDVVYVIVPTGLHMKYAVIAANTGKHVFCEKPMAMNVEQCEKIISECDKNKVKLSIGYRMQHEPNTRTVIGYADSKPYGEIKSMEAHSCYDGGGRASGWRVDKELGGGALYDMGVYAINALRYGSGQDPVGVKAAAQSTNFPDVYKEVDETTAFELDFESGIVANGLTSVGERSNHLKVRCENGWYEIEPLQSYNGVKGRTSDGKKLDVFCPNQQAQQIDDDALAIMEGRDMLVPGKEGMKDIAIVNAIQGSVATGEYTKI